MLDIIFDSTKNNKNNELTYNLVKYIKYEYGSPSDEAKKSLEAFFVKKHIPHNISSKLEKWSLDIGCATARYPLIFSDLGFRCVGYDVSEAAVQISQHKAEYKQHIEIEHKDAAKECERTNEFDVITCMMGTINHLSESAVRELVSCVYKSLKKDGIFIFSSWNFDSSFCSYLSIYTPKEVRALKDNFSSEKTALHSITSIGFADLSSHPIALFPDSCYEQWHDFIDMSDLYNYEDQSDLLKSTNMSQMNIHVAKK